ncbi:uncharacterized protein LOC107366019 [Tetranychus urticae]|uniref:Uncharacterized protein n=1 Tax=Tetranychus urticae TaxID=32264 RepID=T1KNR8_TETUR|nr:uncharacterized protein LOC107366019 [Tetranychus urticae]
MSENKITIKVKLSGEDYHDIVIDWTDETCEYHQQLYKQLAAYTGIPIFYIRNSYISKNNFTMPFWLENTDYSWRFTRPPTVFDKNERNTEKCRSQFNDGDCFTLRICVRICGDQDQLFDFAVDLIGSNDSHGNECSVLWCQHTNTRAVLDKMIRIVTNLELQKKIKAQLPVQFTSASDEYKQLLTGYNIRQHLYAPCVCVAGPLECRLYLPHRG